MCDQWLGPAIAWAARSASTIWLGQATVGVVEAGTNSSLPGAGDDGLDRPTVTPVPAPPDDQLIRLAKVGSVVGGIAAFFFARWLHKHLEVRWR